MVDMMILTFVVQLLKGHAMLTNFGGKLAYATFIYFTGFLQQTRGPQRRWATWHGNDPIHLI